MDWLSKTRTSKNPGIYFETERVFGWLDSSFLCKWFSTFGTCTCVATSNVSVQLVLFLLEMF